jgi:hypothetical protein
MNEEAVQYMSLLGETGTMNTAPPSRCHENIGISHYAYQRSN